MLLAFIFLQFSSIFCTESGLDAYQRYSRDRWDKLYSALLPECFESNLIDGNHIIKIYGFRESNSVVAIHNQGNLIESECNTTKITEYITGIIAACDGAESVHFKVFEGWASPEFHSTLHSFGYHDVELSTIMSLDNIDGLIDQRKLAEGYKIAKARTESELGRFAEFHGSMIKWAIMKMKGPLPESLSFWQIIEETTGDIACALLVEVINDIVGIQMVETAPEHRRKGLASFLMHEAVSSAFTELDVKSVVLGASPMAVSLYARLGFKTHGHYRSYEYKKHQPPYTIKTLV